MQTQFTIAEADSFHPAKVPTACSAVLKFCLRMSGKFRCRHLSVLTSPIRAELQEACSKPEELPRITLLSGGAAWKNSLVCQQQAFVAKDCCMIYLDGCRLFWVVIHPGWFSLCVSAGLKDFPVPFLDTPAAQQMASCLGVQ